MKERVPVFLMVTNYMDENAQHFFLCFERSHWPCRKASVVFLPGSRDAVEGDLTQ